MNNLDDAIAENTAFDLLEIRQANQAKSKTVTFAGGHSYEIPKNVYSNEIYQVKEQDNEIN